MKIKFYNDYHFNLNAPPHAEIFSPFLTTFYDESIKTARLHITSGIGM